MYQCITQLKSWAHNLVVDQVNNAFHDYWNANLEVISKELLTSEEKKRKKMIYCIVLSELKVILVCWLFSLCGIYNKTIIHLSIGKSHRYLTQLLVSNNWRVSCKKKEVSYIGGGGGIFRQTCFDLKTTFCIVFVDLCFVFET